MANKNVNIVFILDKFNPALSGIYSFMKEEITIFETLLHKDFINQKGG